MTVYLSGKLVNTDEELVELYQQRLGSRGFTSETLFYKSQEQHALKLESFARLIWSLPATDSLLDVGCGYGELLRFVTVSGQYLGIDLVEAFVAEARARYPKHRFECCDFFEYSGPKYEWVLLAGVLSSVPASEALLCRASEIAYRGVVFDVSVEERFPADYIDLSRWSEEQVEEVLHHVGFVLTETYDADATWKIFRAERGLAVDRARTGSRQGGE